MYSKCWYIVHYSKLFVLLLFSLCTKLWSFKVGTCLLKHPVYMERFSLAKCILHVFLLSLQTVCHRENNSEIWRYVEEDQWYVLLYTVERWISQLLRLAELFFRSQQRWKWACPLVEMWYRVFMERANDSNQREKIVLRKPFRGIPV
jgi:hypothetical protein